MPSFMQALLRSNHSQTRIRLQSFNSQFNINKKLTAVVVMLRLVLSFVVTIPQNRNTVNIYYRNFSRSSHPRLLPKTCTANPNTTLCLAQTFVVTLPSVFMLFSIIKEKIILSRKMSNVKTTKELTFTPLSSAQIILTR